MRKFFICALVLIVFVASMVAANSLSLSIQKEEPVPRQDALSSPSPTVLPGSGEKEISSDLPFLFIDTGGNRIYKEEKTWSTVSVIDSKGKNSSWDTPVFSSLSTVKYRGNSSYYVFDKRQYRIKFYKNENKSQDYGLFGMGAHSEWVLYGPFLDRSLVRNRLVYTLSRELLEWAPDSHYFELFVDGEYQGVYLAVEPVTVGANRLNLFQYGMSSGQTSYLLKRDRAGTEENAISTYGEKKEGRTSHELSIQYPSSANLTHRQTEWITADIDRFEEALYSDSFASEANGYAAYIDVDNFVDYYLINEFAMIPDASYLSTFVYKNITGKIKMTVWDFNDGFNNYPWTNYTTDRFFLENNTWFDRLLQDRAFVDKVVARYHELRREKWTDERLNALIDSYVEEIGSDAIQRNFEIWGYTFHENLLSKEDGISRDPKSFEEAVSMLKDCVFDRTAFLDSHIEELYQYCIN